MKDKTVILFSFKELFNEKDGELCIKLFKELQFNDLFSIIYSNLKMTPQQVRDDRKVMFNVMLNAVEEI